MNDDDHATLIRAAQIVAAALENISDANARQADALENIANAISAIGDELRGIGQEIGWGLDPTDSRKGHIGT